MGLRIIDRQFQTRRSDISEAERLASLEIEARRWVATRGNVPLSTFIDHFQAVKSRLAPPSTMAEMADKIRGEIVGHNDSPLSHNKVDIATLLELL